jgi:hypothetical protein
MDVNLKKNSRLLTKMVDALPFLQTKETSSVTLNAEYAQLLPGTSNIVQGDGTSFIDDYGVVRYIGKEKCMSCSLSRSDAEGGCGLWCTHEETKNKCISYDDYACKNYKDAYAR